MTTKIGGTRCKYCGRNPEIRRPGEGFHNEGCPEDVPSGEKEKREWDRGYAYGFADNYLESWRLRSYSPSFRLGYRVGYAEIDVLIEEAIEARNNYGEYH